MSAFPLMPLVPPTPKLTTLTLIGTSTSILNGTISMPTGLLPGDWALMIDAVYDSTAQVSITPSGFVSLYTHGDGSWMRAYRVSHRLILSAAESGAAITSSTGYTWHSDEDSSWTEPDGTTRKIILVFRGNVPIGSMSYIPGASTGSNGNPGTISTTPATGGLPCIVWGVASTFNHAAVVFESIGALTAPPFGAELAINSLRVGYTLYPRGAVPPTQSADMVDFGSSNLISIAAMSFEGVS
ncbi:MAG: hypothetical protein K0B16_15405 [Burkholderiaceae bacterium]|nr:hypothetical protein [Burkholderiaceae bacterium]